METNNKWKSGFRHHADAPRSAIEMLQRVRKSASQKLEKHFGGSPMRTLWHTFAVLLAVAAILNVLAFFAGVSGDIPKEDASNGKQWFGYYSTFYWSINYATILPFGIGCCVAIMRYVHQLSPEGGGRAKQLAVSCAVLLAVLIVGSDLRRVIFLPARDYVQWNHIGVDEASFTSANRYFRTAMVTIAYTYYFVGYATFLSMVASVTWLATAKWRTQTATEVQLRIAHRMMRLFRVSILILLFHFTVVRVCKIEMYFRASDQPVPIFNPFKLKESADAYLERVSSGLYFDLALIATWSVLLFYSHIRYWQLCQRANDVSFSVRLYDLEPALFIGGAQKIGKAFTLLSGLLLFGIVFPPPSRHALLSVSGFLVAGYLVKQGLTTKKE